MNELYLAHHGIRGQHWGVRRFQDEDGTMTAAYDPSHRKVKHYDTTGYITSDYYASRPVCYVTRRTK